VVQVRRAQRAIGWIERYCVIPEGKDVGKPVRLRDWQRREIEKIYDNPYGTRNAIISFGKKNAKTTLSAFLLLLHLSGPEAKQNSQLVSTAQSREQAAVLFELAAKIVRMSPTLSGLISIRDTLKQLYDPEYGTTYRALSADASTAHGQSPIFAVHDELGQVRGPRSELYNAIENAMGAHEQPMSVVISTQAPTDADLLSILIDDALSKADPRTVISLYTAPMDIDPFSEEALRAANPAFGDFLNAQEVTRQAEQARRMPALEALYRNYTLNQRVEASSPFVTQSVWAQNGGAPEDGNVVYGGLDLSETNDLTALVLVSAATKGRLSVKPTFFLPEYELGERARKDRVPYDVFAKEGHVITTPGKSISYEYVAQYLAAIFLTKDVRKIGFDRWNMKHLRPWLIRQGLSESFIDDRFVEFGQGYQSMTPALRTLESLLLDSKLLHGNNPVLRMCAANAIVKSDEVGNRKLDKKRSRGRIDGMVALAMAVAMAYENLAVRPVFSVPTERLVRA
jgi:phage terminase large subunit-like protein